MRYYVTDSDQNIDIGITDTVVITTKNTLENELKGKHIPVYCASVDPGFIGYGDVERRTEELINKHIQRIIESDDQRIMWNVIPDAPDGIFGVSCKKAFMAVDNWIELLKQKPEEIIFRVSGSNRILCLVGRVIAEQRGISVKILYDSWKERIKGINIKYTGLYKTYWNFARYMTIRKLILCSRLKQMRGGNKKYQFGMVIASDASRILQWGRQGINAYQEAFGKENVRTLCIDCNKTYRKLTEEGFPCDNLAQWFDKEIAKKEEREYKKYRKLVYEYVHKNLNYTYKEVDMTQIILNFFDHYLWAEKASHYRLKMIYESYFAHNSYWCIEPWCSTRYYQVNISCLASRNSKHCRINDIMFLRNDSIREVYPDLLDFIFFSKVGFDLRSAYYEPNQWGKKRFYASISFSYFIQTWNKNREKDYYNGIRNIALLPGDGNIEKEIFQVGRIIECLKDFNVICKFHPQLADNPSVLEYMNKNKNRTGVIFVESNENISSVIEKADAVITTVSTAMLDTMAAHKVCILVPLDEESDMVFCMKEYLNIWTVPLLENELRKITADPEGCEIWYREQIKRQDAFFEEDGQLDDPYVQLKKIYEAQQKNR